MSSPFDSSPHLDDGLVTISAQSGLDGYRRRNFYIINFLQWLVWMIFHFAVVFFFTFQLQSVVLVGIFLAIANLVAFGVDIPIGIIVKRYSAKKLFILSSLLQLVAMGIFFVLIFWVFQMLGSAIPDLDSDIFAEVKSWFFGSAFSFLGLLIAALCYGVAKEIIEITNLSYILSNAHPSDYAEVMARNHIFFGVGSLVGLLASGTILSLNPAFAVILLSGLIILSMGFTYRFFHNAVETVRIEDIERFVISVKKLNKENIKEYITTTISKEELVKVISKTKYLFLKPHQEKTEKLSLSDLITHTRSDLITIYRILSQKPLLITIIWTISLVLTFGFWDTFAATFLIDFLDEVKHGYGYLMLGLIAIPAYGLQEWFSGRLADRLGIMTVGIMGLILSGGSLIMMGIFSLGGDPSPLMIIAAALVNSIGYAACMSIGQNKFLESYNEVYAREMKLTEIDANASSAPMKILQNLANVVGLVLGGILLALPGGYSTFFILFGVMILALVVWSVRIRGEVRL